MAPRATYPALLMLGLFLSIESRAETTDASPCPEQPQFGWYEETKKERPPLLKLPDQVCNELLLVEQTLLRLLPAAGFDIRYAKLRVAPHTKNQVSWYHPSNFIVLSIDMIAPMAHYEDFAVLGLSHELGHGVQWAKGLTVLSPDNETIAVHGHTSAQLEAHADLLGGQIAQQAGFVRSTVRSGWEKFQSCERIRAYTQPDTHPSVQDRWVNHLVAEKAIAARLKNLQSFKPERARQVYDGDVEEEPTPDENPLTGARFTMLATPDVFDASGRMKATGPAPPRPRLRRVNEERDAKPRDDQFQASIYEIWSGAFSKVGGWLYPSVVKDLAATACGVPGIQDLSSAVSQALTQDYGARLIAEYYLGTTDQ